MGQIEIWMNKMAVLVYGSMHRSTSFVIDRKVQDCAWIDSAKSEGIRLLKSYTSSERTEFSSVTRS